MSQTAAAPPDPNGGGRAERLAENVYFQLAARASMLVISVFLLPLTMAIALRTYDTVREVREAQIRDTTRLERVVGDVAELQRNGWTVTEALRERADTDRRLAALDSTDDRLEQRIESLSRPRGR